MAHENEGCDVACATRGLECSEREMSGHLHEVDSADKMHDVMERLDVGKQCVATWEWSTYQQLAETNGAAAPRFRPHDHTCEYSPQPYTFERGGCPGWELGVIGSDLVDLVCLLS